MYLNLLYKGDWWIHILSNFLLFAIIYFYQKTILKKNAPSKNVLIQLLLSNLIDLDHLFSVPMFDPSRCSINNHFLHSTYLFPAYVIGLFSKFKYFFLGVLVHLLIDYLYCVFFLY